jgi:hypothetical protein
MSRPTARSVSDAEAQPFLFEDLVVQPPSVERCPLVVTQRGAFARRVHQAERPTTTVLDGIVRMTWTCSTCGNVRGRVW